MQEWHIKMGKKKPLRPAVGEEERKDPMLGMASATRAGVRLLSAGVIQLMVMVDLLIPERRAASVTIPVRS